MSFLTTQAELDDAEIELIAGIALRVWNFIRSENTHLAEEAVLSRIRAKLIKQMQAAPKKRSPR